MALETGGLLRLAVKVMQIMANAHVDYVPLVNILGQLFQVRDDYMNLQSLEYSENKGFAEDLTEGKFSFPVIHHIRTAPDSQLLNILRQRTTDVALKKYALDLLAKTDSFAYTRAFLAGIEREARDEIARLGGNVHLDAILDYLHTP